MLDQERDREEPSIQPCVLWAVML